MRFRGLRRTRSGAHGRVGPTTEGQSGMQPRLPGADQEERVRSCFCSFLKLTCRFVPDGKPAGTRRLSSHGALKVHGDVSTSVSTSVSLSVYISTCRAVLYLSYMWRVFLQSLCCSEYRSLPCSSSLPPMLSPVTFTSHHLPCACRRGAFRFLFLLQAGGGGRGRLPCTCKSPSPPSLTKRGSRGAPVGLPGARHCSECPAWPHLLLWPSGSPAGPTQGRAMWPPPPGPVPASSPFGLNLGLSSFQLAMLQFCNLQNKAAVTTCPLWS